MSGGGERSRENVAAGWFTVAMAACLGVAGVVIAAIAVGAERMWSGRNPDRSTSEGWRQGLADHRAWLDRDRDRTAAWRQARRDWYAGGGKGSRPAMPSAGARLGTWLRRRWSRAAVRADGVQDGIGRFADGFREGWAAADAARRDGAGFREIVRGRPEGPNRVAAEPEGNQEPPAKSPPNAGPEPDPPPGIIGQRCNRPVCVYGQIVGTRPWPGEPNSSPDADLLCNRCGWLSSNITARTFDERVAGMTIGVAAPVNKPSRQQEEPMPAQTAIPTAAPAGETNLDLTVADLNGINTTLTRVEELNDQLSGARTHLQEQVSRASERVAATGGTTATRQALDEANGVVSMLGGLTSQVADTTTSARDQVSAAEAGLQPAREAQDALHASGAQGEFVASATAD